MNIISIVGHPSSSLKEVEALLHRCGMQNALPSRRNGMTPHDIAQTLIKAHQCEPIDTVTDEATFNPLKVSPVWQGMALDLLLGNIDQPFWGWADSNTLYLLEYWRSQDPKMVFVFVYDHPRSVLKALAQAVSHSGTTVANARSALENWAAYNGALLKFYLCHPECSMLVSAEQVKSSVHAYLDQLGKKLQPSLEFNTAKLEIVDQAALEVLPPSLIPAIDLLEMTGNQSVEDWQALDVESYVIDELLLQHPQIMQLLAEIQSAASLPAITSEQQAADPMRAWAALVRHRSVVGQTMAQLARIQEQAAADLQQIQAQSQRLLADANSQGQRQIAALQQEQEKLTQTTEAFEEQLALASKLASNKTVEANELKEENDSLFRQLHTIQKQLERYHQENLTLKLAQQNATDLQRSQAQSHQLLEDSYTNAQRQISALQQEQANLIQSKEAEAKAKEQALAQVQTLQQEKAALAQAKIAADANKLQQENKLLLNQLNVVQEELERYHFENQSLKQSNKKPVKPNLYGAAERVKRQLTYRLGAQVLAHSKTLWGILLLFPALLIEFFAFKRDMKARTGEKLPPISQYADAHDAERVRQHLSYRLGQVVLLATEKPYKLPLLPFSLMSEAKVWRHERSKA